MRTAIVGAGAAGLSLALMLDGDVTVFEKEATPGGLCRSTTVDGFTFDQGPHILGGIPEAVEWIKESTGIEFVEGETRNVGWLDGEFVEHPFVDPIVGRRYMAKMWKSDPSELAPLGLSAQRDRRPGGVKRFLYPKRGGYQAITDAWAAKVQPRLNVQLNSPEKCYGRVVWTNPRQGMPYNALATVTFGYRGTPPPFTAIYLPEDWTPFHRLSFPSAFSPNNAPDGCYSIQGEVSYRLGSRPEWLLSWMEKTVHELGLVDGPLVMEDSSLIPYAYPVPERQLARPTRPTVSYHGRTGGHRYLNVDGVVAASMRLAGELNCDRSVSR